MKKDEDFISQNVRDQTHPIEFLISLLKYIQDDIATINPIMFQEIRKYYPQAWHLMSEFHSDFIKNTMIHQLKTGMDMGLFRSDINPEIVIRLKQHTFNLVIDIYFEMGSQYSLQEIQWQEMLISMYGLCSPAGTVYLNDKLTQMQT